MARRSRRRKGKGHKGVMARGALPALVKDGLRALIAADNPRVFENRQRKLTKAPVGQTYYEFDVGTDQEGGRGAHRVVGLFDSGGALVKAYFTSDHYADHWWEIE